MTKAAQLYQRRERLYRIHTVSALLVAVWLAVLAITGFAMNHQEALGLAEWQVSDRLLPDYYRAEYRTGSTPALVILTDLHSGRIFGAYGYLITDAVGVLVLLSIVSGFISYRLRKKLQQSTLNGAAQTADNSDA